jgi:hypothetical protein
MRESAVLVEVVGLDLREVDIALLIPLDEPIGVEPVASPRMDFGFRMT